MFFLLFRVLGGAYLHFLRFFIPIRCRRTFHMYTTTRFRFRFAKLTEPLFHIIHKTLSSIRRMNPLSRSQQRFSPLSLLFRPAFSSVFSYKTYFACLYILCISENIHICMPIYMCARLKYNRLRNFVLLL